MKFMLLLTALTLLHSVTAAAETTRKAVWEGNIHLGDNPGQFTGVVSAGMALQIPVVLNPEKKGQLIVVTRDIQTLAGDGHYAELLGHYEDDDGPAREYVVETFRLRGDSN